MMAMAAPRPKSPPASPDPCGRHRLQHAVDTLHREIGFLEGEINSIEGVHAASKCCKEVDEFIGKNVDPFITIARACLSYLSWICCCGGCSPFQLKGQGCCPCATMERLCGRCGGNCPPCRVGCRGPCRTPCPRCSCGCACSCPRCSCACPPCGAGCCAPRCCPCL